MATATIHPRIFVLAARADKHVASLSTSLNALIALERFVSLERATDDENMAQLRTSQGRLIRALHEDMQRRIEMMAGATAELRAAVESLVD